MNGANPVPPPISTILLSSEVPSCFFSSIVKAPVGFTQRISSCSLLLNNSVVNRPGTGFLTHLTSNSKTLFCSGGDAIEYALLTIFPSDGTCSPIVKNCPALKSGTLPSDGFILNIIKSSFNTRRYEITPLLSTTIQLSNLADK